MRRLAPALASLLVLLTVTGCSDGNMLNMAGGGLCGLIIFVLDVIAVVEIWGSTKDTTSKVLWTLAIFFLPVLGLILYYFFGR